MIQFAFQKAVFKAAKRFEGVVNGARGMKKTMILTEYAEFEIMMDICTVMLK